MNTLDSPARRGFYEGVYETFEQGYSLTAISDATGLSVPKLQQIIRAERMRRLSICCICHAPATVYLRGLINDSTVAEDGLYACDAHEEFVARGIVFGNGYAGLHAVPIIQEKSA